MTTSDRDALHVLNIAAETIAALSEEPRGLLTIRKHMRESQAGARSSNLEADRGGDRYETILWDGTEHKVRIPSNDPTGEAAIGVDEPGQALERLARLLRQLDSTVTELAALRSEWAPRAGAQRPADDSDGPGSDWCVSCWRDDKHCQPTGGRHAGRCRWCGEWRGVHGEDPPLAVIRAHHRGERITSQMLARYNRKKAS